MRGVDGMTDWWFGIDQTDSVIPMLAMVLSGISLCASWRLSKTQSASSKNGARALQECEGAQRVAAAALDVSNELRTQLAELKRFQVQQHDNRATKAELGARIRRGRLEDETSGTASAWSFRVENEGDGAAGNMQLLVDGKRAYEHPSIFAPIQEPTALAARDHIEYPLAVPLVPEQRRPLQVNITWDDDSRAHRTGEFTLTAD